MDFIARMYITTMAETNDEREIKYGNMIPTFGLRHMDFTVVTTKMITNSLLYAKPKIDEKKQNKYKIKNETGYTFTDAKENKCIWIMLGGTVNVQ